MHLWLGYFLMKLLTEVFFERRKVFEELYGSRNAALRAYEKAERELSFARLRVNFLELYEVKNET